MDGGKGHEIGDYHGGGGGGVLVNGEGPACRGSATYWALVVEDAISMIGINEDVSNIEGSPGVVLFEIINNL